MSHSIDPLENADGDKIHKEVPDGKTDTSLGSTIHYQSPVSLTYRSLAGETRRSLFDYYQFMPQGSGFTGEYAYSYSERSSELYVIEHLERTCAIIKPEAVYFEDVVIRKILQQGFKILQKRKLQLTPEQVSELYAHHYGSLSFPYLVVSMSAGPVVVLCLAAMNAVHKWKQLVRGTGTLSHCWFLPRSMRRRFGCQQNLDNVLHASEDRCSADREVRYFFPESILEPLLRYEPEVTDYLSLYVNPTLLDACTELCKKKPIEPLLFFADWLLQNNPYQPKMQPEIARLPT